MLHNNKFKQPADFAVLCQRIGATAPHLATLFKINKRTTYHWINGRYNKPVKPPQAIYNAIFNLNNSFFELAKQVAEDGNIEYIITYHDEYSLREEFPDCFFGISSHRALVSIILGFNPSLKTIPSVNDETNIDWCKIANVAPLIDVDDMSNIRVFKRTYTKK